MKQFIERLKQLTAKNQHTDARILIASRYDYLEKHLRMYNAIKTISKFEGKTPRLLLDIRNQFDITLRAQIVFNHGRVIADLIEDAL